MSVCSHFGGGGNLHPSDGRWVPHLANGGGYSHLVDRGYPIRLMGVPPSGQWGVPLIGLDGGTSLPPLGLDGGTPLLALDGVPTPAPLQVDRAADRRQSSKARTCYATGSVPLAFTQEDFLVVVLFLLVVNEQCLCVISSFLHTCTDTFLLFVCELTADGSICKASVNTDDSM